MFCPQGEGGRSYTQKPGLALYSMCLAVERMMFAVFRVHPTNQKTALCCGQVSKMMPHGSPCAISFAVR